MRLLVVRLTSLGDVVHAIPAVAALRRAFPAARIDWLVGARCRDLVALVTVVDRCLATPPLVQAAELPRLLRTLRGARYDVAIDLQGLVKSALLARASGARRVVGFGRGQVRERAAALLYSETPEVGCPAHVIDRNLALAAALGAERGPAEFPIAAPDADVMKQTRGRLGSARAAPFALLNPGAAWASKCWPPARFGALARSLRDTHGLPSVVAWGPGEQHLAAAAAHASDGAARPAPPTRVGDLVALARAAAVMVAGDTGPLHLAAALGTPVVGLYGPSDPARNGPWSPDDVVVSRFGACHCRQSRPAAAGALVRRCGRASSCVADIPVGEVAAAVALRMERAGRA